MSEKVRDIGLDEFVEQVLDKDPELAEKVQESEIDAKAIISKAKPSIDKYGVATGVAYAVARLKEAVLEANSEVVKGLLVGERDKFGTNSPIRIPLLNSKGDHMEVISWDTKVKYGDSKIPIPFPSVATVKVINEGEYKGVPNIRLVTIESYEELNTAEVITKLSKVAKSVGEVDGGDELGVVVVKGRIEYISPATRWKDKEKDGSWQLYMPNQRDTPVTHPVMQITLEKENGNQVRAIFDRQRNAAPTIVVEDFVELCADAVAQSQDPMEQAKFLGGIVRGRDVIIVGFMTKYSPQVNINYVDIGAYAMYDASASEQESLSKPKPSAKKEAKKPTKDTDDSDDDEPEPVKKQGASKKPAESTGKSKSKESPADKLKKKIKSYCDLYGVEIGDITADKMIEAFKLDGVMSKGSVDAVIDEIKSESE